MDKMKRFAWMSLTLLVTSASCGGEDDAEQATATIAALGSSAVTGTATAKGGSGGVTLTVKVSGAAPGEHGVHIHQNGACGDTTNDMGMVVVGGGAGPHWNPDTKKHGHLGVTEMHHLGDLGNVIVASDGTGTLTITSKAWSIGTGATNDIVGHAIVIHAGPDDLMTDPAGNSGGRIACGVITKS